jgi:hypothetical protein
MRAFDNSAGLSALMEGLRAHYNLVRDDEALGTTPGEVAGNPIVRDSGGGNSLGPAPGPSREIRR